MAQDIQIKIVAVDQATKPIMHLRKALDTAGLSMKKFNRFSRENFLVHKANAGMVNRLTGKFQSYGDVVQKATVQSRRFKFEWLSIMFAGMALQRVFGGVVSEAFKLFGVTQLIGTMWSIVMIPVMELLLPLILKLTGVFMNLSESWKLSIGIIVLVTAALGLLLTVFGSVALAIGGIAILFGVAFATAGAIVAAVAIALIALSVGAALLIKNWSRFGIKTKAFLASLLPMISIPILVIKNWSKIIPFFSTMLKTIGSWFKTWFFDKPKEWVGGMVDWIIDKVMFLVNKIKSLFSRIGGAFAAPLGVIGRGLSALGSRQFGGPIPTTGPYLLHAGERIIPRNEARGGSTKSINLTVSPVYNVNVADKFEMEKLINRNNSQLVEEIKRHVNI